MICTVLKQGSNICQVMQQNERIKCLGLFKHRVPKLLNLKNLTMMPNIKEISLFSILHLSFRYCYSRSFIAYLSRSLSSCTGMHSSFTTPISVWSPYTFINVLASNHAIKLVNTSTSTCHSTLDRWTIGN